MIIWSGYGYLIFVIVFMNSLIAELITESITKNETLYQENLIPLGCSLLASGIITRMLTLYFVKKRKQDSGTSVFDHVPIAKGNHALFFIPFAFWFYILTLAGGLIILSQIIRMA